MQKIMLISLVVLFFVCGCEQDNVFFEKGDLNSSRKVLIAGTTSQFKKEVVAKIIEKLGTQDYYFKVIGLNQLEKEKTENYRAILLVTAFMAGKIDGRVKQYLQKNPSDPKIIVFYTRGTEDPLPDWSKPDIKVDAVSSSSLSDRVDKRVDELISLIIKRF